MSKCHTAMGPIARMYGMGLLALTNDRRGPRQVRGDGPGCPLTPITQRPKIELHGRTVVPAPLPIPRGGAPPHNPGYRGLDLEGQRERDLVRRHGTNSQARHPAILRTARPAVIGGSETWKNAV